jgi:hypothetical protein
MFENSASHFRSIPLTVAQYAATFTGRHRALQSRGAVTFAHAVGDVLEDVWSVYRQALCSHTTIREITPVRIHGFRSKTTDVTLLVASQDDLICYQDRSLTSQIGSF